MGKERKYEQKYFLLLWLMHEQAWRHKRGRGAAKMIITYKAEISTLCLCKNNTHQHVSEAGIQCAASGNVSKLAKLWQI